MDIIDRNEIPSVFQRKNSINNGKLLIGLGESKRVQCLSIKIMNLISFTMTSSNFTFIAAC